MPNKRTVLSTSGDIISGPSFNNGDMYVELENIYITNISDFEETFDLYVMTHPQDTSGTFNFDDNVDGNILLKSFAVSSSATAFNDFGKLYLDYDQVLVAKASSDDVMASHVFYRNVIDRELINRKVFRDKI